MGGKSVDRHNGVQQLAVSAREGGNTICVCPCMNQLKAMTIKYGQQGKLNAVFHQEL